MDITKWLKIAVLLAWDRLTILVIVVVTPFSLALLFKQCDKIEKKYANYTEKANLLEADYEELFSHPTLDGSTPLFNGVKYEFTFNYGNRKIKQEAISKKYQEKLIHFLEQGQLDSLEVRYVLGSPERSMIFTKEK